LAREETMPGSGPAAGATMGACPGAAATTGAAAAAALAAVLGARGAEGGAAPLLRDAEGAGRAGARAGSDVPAAALAGAFTGGEGDDTGGGGGSLAAPRAPLPGVPADSRCGCSELLDAAPVGAPSSGRFRSREKILIARPDAPLSSAHGASDLR
jgi:hypothetical protein